MKITYVLLRTSVGAVLIGLGALTSFAQETPSTSGTSGAGSTSNEASTSTETESDNDSDSDSQLPEPSTDTDANIQSDTQSDVTTEVTEDASDATESAQESNAEHDAASGAEGDTSSTAPPSASSQSTAAQRSQGAANANRTRSQQRGQAGTQSGNQSRSRSRTQAESDLSDIDSGTESDDTESDADASVNDDSRPAQDRARGQGQSRTQRGTDRNRSQQANRSQDDDQSQDQQDDAFSFDANQQATDANRDQSRDSNRRGSRSQRNQARQDDPSDDDRSQRFSLDSGAEAELGEGRLDVEGRAQAGANADIDNDLQLGATLDVNEQNQLIVNDLSDAGVFVDSGIRQGDVIMSIGGRTFRSQSQLQSWLTQGNFDSRVPVVVMRGGRQRTLYLDNTNMLSGTAGVVGRALNLGARFSSDAQGRLIVSDLMGSGLLAAADLQPGDVIIQAAGQPVASQTVLTRVIRNYSGSRLPLVVLRNGQRETIYLTGFDSSGSARYDSEYEEEYTASGRGWLGVFLDTRYQDRAVVESVEVGSGADEAGVRAGDWIVGVNGERVRTPQDLTQAIRDLGPGDDVRLDISRRVNGQLTAQLTERPERQGRYDRDSEYSGDADSDAAYQQRSYRGSLDTGADVDVDATPGRIYEGPVRRGSVDADAGVDVDQDGRINEGPIRGRIRGRIGVDR